MKINWREILNHRYTGVLLRSALFTVLLVGSFHVHDRINTLEKDGCKAYYTDFQGVEDFSDKHFFSEEGLQTWKKSMRPDTIYGFKNNSLEKNSYNVSS